MWTRFFDIKGGNDGYPLKVGCEFIYVELPKNAALDWFGVRFGRNPTAESIRYAGPDFGTLEFPTLAEAVKFSIPATFNDTEAQWRHLDRVDVLVVYEGEARGLLKQDAQEHEREDRAGYESFPEFLQRIEGMTLYGDMPLTEEETTVEFEELQEIIDGLTDSVLIREQGVVTCRLCKGEWKDDRGQVVHDAGCVASRARKMLVILRGREVWAKQIQEKLAESQGQAYKLEQRLHAAEQREQETLEGAKAYNTDIVQWVIREHDDCQQIVNAIALLDSRFPCGVTEDLRDQLDFYRGKMSAFQQVSRELDQCSNRTEDLPF